MKKKRTNKQELEHMRKLQEEWLKKNKPTKCDDAYMDNPYINKGKQTIEF